MLSYGGSVWIGTPNGLHRYRADDNVWSAYGTQNGLLSSGITNLDMRGDVLWIGQTAGLTAFDQRSNTMLHYDNSKGLAVGPIRAVDFESDYVWTGGNRGASRYDNLIEEWQSIGSGQGLIGDTVHAFAQGEDRIYIATNAGVNEYDPQHERWRIFRVPGEDGVRDAFNAGGKLWLLRDGDLLRFDVASRIFSPYRLPGFAGGDIREIIIQGNGFWLVTDIDLWNYDAAADALRSFPEIAQLPDRQLKAVALSADGGTLWFSTASGLTRYERSSGSWTYYTSASGMPYIDIRVLFSIGKGIVTFSETSLVYFLQYEDRWYELPLRQSDEDGRTRVSLDPAKGSYADFGGGIRLDLSGSRSSWLFYDPLGEHDYVNYPPTNRNDLKARLDLGGGRRISAVYNDSDYEYMVYGAEYRGAREDIVQSLQSGDLRVEGAGSLLQQDFGIFGGGGRAVYGERTEKYGRSLLEVQAQSGHKTTTTQTDVFQGFSREREATINDVDWMRESFYHLRADRRFEALEGATVRLYRLIRPTERRHSRDDITATTIAGIVGDWRPKVEGADYILDRDRSVLRNLYPLGEEVFAVRITKGGMVEELLLRDSTTLYLEIRNRYAIGYEIVPSSLQLKILGPGGIEAPLAQFGLDKNGDGRVDAEYMDYANGTLSFPEDHPFPAGAYLDPGTVTYTMEVRYETGHTGSYDLSKSRIIRGSERVTVDGIPVNAGEDYILDYSSGSLLFTRDGVVLDDSRVEISYEYVRLATEERFTQANLTFSPSDIAQASIGAGSFNEEGTASGVRFVQAGGEVRWQTQAFDLRVRPEYRHTISDSTTGDAAGLSASFSTEAARISVLSSIRSDGYREPVASAYSAGRLGSDHAVKGEYELSPELRAFVTYYGRTGTDTARGIDTDEQTSSGGLQWSRQDYPSITLRGEYMDVSDQFADRTRRGGRLDAAWTPSEALLGTTGFRAARFSAYARIAEEDVSGTLRDGRFRTQNYFFRSVLTPRQLFSVNLWYQGDAREKRSTEGVFAREYQTEKANLDILMEHINGLSLGGRLTRDVRQMQTSPSLLDRSASTTIQANARIAPGTWIPSLQRFVLYGNVSQYTSGYYANSTAETAMLLSLFSGDTGERRSGNANMGYETRLEWRPIAGLLYSVSGILNDSRNDQYSSTTKSGFWTMTHYGEWRPDNRSLLAMQFQFRKQQYSYGYTESQPAVWAERRFSRLLLTRLTLHTSIHRSETSYARNSRYNIQPSGTVTLTLDNAPVIRRAELRFDAGYSIEESRTEWYLAETQNSTQRGFHNTFYLDLYPHPVLFIRFRHFMQWHSGPGFNNYRYFGIDGWRQPDAELKIVMQL